MAGRRVPALLTFLSVLILAPLVLWGFGAPFSHIPWTTDHTDGLFTAAAVKALTLGTWGPFIPFQEPSLGYPGGLNAADFPFTEPLQIVIVKLITLFSDDPFVTINAYYVLTFALTAAAFVLVAGALGVRPLTAVVGGVLFAFIPFHLQRRAHLYFTAHYFIPIVLLMCLDLASCTKRRWHLLAAFFIGWWQVYFAFFSCLFFITAGLFSKRYARAASWCGAVALALFIALLPSTLYRLEHGKNRETGKRWVAETEHYGLRAGAFLLPPPEHRLLGFIGKAYDGPPIEGQRIEYIGAFAIIGLIAAWRRQPLLLLLAVVAYLYATPYGGASLFARWFSPQLRSVNRISCFIAGIGALSAVLALNKKHPAWSVLALIFLLDQVPAIPFQATAAAPPAFYAELSAKLDKGSAVLQLPYVPFPEWPPVEGMQDYQHFEAYVFTSGYRWSYGAMKGRPQAKAIEEASAALDLSAYDAVLIDKRGYADKGADVERRLADKGASKIAEGQWHALYAVNPSGKTSAP